MTPAAPTRQVLRVLSLGAGVQSTTLFLMACEGEERIDAAIFADTGWEPHWVYEHLDRLEAVTRVMRGPSIHRVGSGTLRQDALDNKTESWMPLFTRDPKTGKPQQLKRQCTSNYKIRPIRRKVRELNGWSLRPVEQVVGISFDEWKRMRDSDVQYIRNVYPLVDRRMTRADCVRWLLDHEYPIPQKSACIACPFRTAAEWREIRADGPSWADAVDFDQRIRSVRLRTERLDVFVHRSVVPLPLVDLSTEQDHGQLELDFDGCGVLCPSEEAA